MLLECLKEDFIKGDIKEFKIEVNGFTFEVAYHPNAPYYCRYTLNYKYNNFNDVDFASSPEQIWDRINGFFSYVEDIKISPEMFKESYILEREHLGCPCFAQEIENLNKVIKEIMGDDYEIE